MPDIRKTHTLEELPLQPYFLYGILHDAYRKVLPHGQMPGRPAGQYNQRAI